MLVSITIILLMHIYLYFYYWIYFQKKKKEIQKVDDVPARFSGINLYKDYTNVKPISSSEEDVKQTSPSLPQFDSSEDEEVFHREVSLVC